MKREGFENNKLHHIFNRGVDKRDIFLELADLLRFFRSMDEFNTLEPIGSIYQNSFRQKTELRGETSKKGKLVDFICFCLNPNHYHFILEQLVDRGIEKFMQRLGTGYTLYFNEKYDRSGSLFQGVFKSVPIVTNEQLLYMAVYVNFNDKIHGLRGETSKSSRDEYIRRGYTNFCKKEIVLDQFKSIEEYKKFAESSWEAIKERKDLEKLFLE